jgi:phospholipase C
MSELASIDTVIVLMLENRSFDHMLGYLYSGQGNVSPANQPFEGLTGNESNPDANGAPVPVSKIEPTTPNCYFMPGADPGEGYMAANEQLYGTQTGPADGTAAPMSGFVKNFADTLHWQSTSTGWSILPGTTPNDIMGCFTPEALPVLSGLARGYASCDHWYGSAPTETLPNRAFSATGTSQGHMDDKTRTFTAPSIFALMTKHDINWAIYGYSSEPLTRHTYTDIASEPDSRFGTFATFTGAAAAGTLPAFVFLEPSWGSSGNSQHPNYDVALGEQLIHDVYYAVRNGPKWVQTLLIITYDEHGGCFDHVPPPWGAVPPDTAVGEFGFDFKRFGPRVPTVLVSPLIEPGTVLRAPDGEAPFDHTSVLKTLETRWALPALTARDAAAPDVSGVLTLTTGRTDDPLAGVVVPTAGAPSPSAGQPSHLQEVLADLISRQQPAGVPKPTLRTETDYERYTRPRVAGGRSPRRSR